MLKKEEHSADDFLEDLLAVRELSSHGVKQPDVA